jgi:hypothetical protein
MTSVTGHPARTRGRGRPDQARRQGYHHRVDLLLRTVRRLRTGLIPASLRDHVAAGQRAGVAPGSLPLPSAIWGGIVVGWAVTTSVLLYLLVHLVATGYLLPGHRL